MSPSNLWLGLAGGAYFRNFTVLLRAERKEIYKAILEENKRKEGGRRGRRKEKQKKGRKNTRKSS